MASPDTHSSSLSPRFVHLDWSNSIEELLCAWPSDRRLVAFCSPSGPWSYFAEPVSRLTLGWLAKSPDLLGHPVRPPEGGLRMPGVDPQPAFASGWLGWISFEAGGVLEERASGLLDPDRRGWSRWPMAEWHRCESVLAFHHETRSWWYAGDTSRPIPPLTPSEPSTFVCEDLHTERTREDFTSAVERARDYIRAGDVYQVNLTHPLAATFEGSARGLFVQMLRAGKPRHGFYAETDDLGVRRCLVGASPELFLHLNAASGLVMTRPMKGTGRHIEEQTLLASIKEQAELAMIVDLMRNDLGRISQPGSMQVLRPREIEQHGEGEALLLQATGTVTGRLREGLTRADVLKATFPGGSISGAPKVRALQIIRELEPRSRGPYCGACGFLDDSGSLEMAMTIRTAAIQGGVGGGFDRIQRGELVYGVGAGIVADSQPLAEWEETLSKAAVLQLAIGRRVEERRA